MFFRVFILGLFLLTVSSFSAAQVLFGNATSLPGEKVLDADPFDVSTGIYSRASTDIFVPDSIPINFARTQRTGDDRSRSFGFGGVTSYDMFIIGDTEKFTWVALVMPDGAWARFTRISPGTSYDGVFEDQSDPSEWRGAQVSWNHAGHWDVRMVNGTQFIVQGCNSNSKPGQCAVTSIQNAAGERLTIQRDREGNILRITSPHGRFVDVSTDLEGRISHAVSDDGQWADYIYDEKGCLVRVLNSRRGVQIFNYDDHRNMVYVSEKGTDNEGPYHYTIRNRYDDQNRFAGQVVSTGQISSVSYQNWPGGRIRQTDVSDGYTVQRHFFDETGWVIKEDLQLGTRALWQLDYVRNPNAHQVLDLTLTCPAGKFSLPVEAAQKIVGMGDERKQFVWQLCQRFAHSGPEAKSIVHD
jgi:YD repeat-containing protein